MKLKEFFLLEDHKSSTNVEIKVEDAPEVAESFTLREFFMAEGPKDDEEPELDLKGEPKQRTELGDFGSDDKLETEPEPDDLGTPTDVPDPDVAAAADALKKPKKEKPAPSAEPDWDEITGGSAAPIPDDTDIADDGMPSDMSGFAGMTPAGQETYDPGTYSAEEFKGVRPKEYSEFEQEVGTPDGEFMVDGSGIITYVPNDVESGTAFKYGGPSVGWAEMGPEEWDELGQASDLRADSPVDTDRRKADIAAAPDTGFSYGDDFQDKLSRRGSMFDKPPEDFDWGAAKRGPGRPKGSASRKMPAAGDTEVDWNAITGGEDPTSSKTNDQPKKGVGQRAPDFGSDIDSGDAEFDELFKNLK